MVLLGGRGGRADAAFMGAETILRHRSGHFAAVPTAEFQRRIVHVSYSSRVVDAEREMAPHASTSPLHCPLSSGSVSSKACSVLPESPVLCEVVDATL